MTHPIIHALVEAHTKPAKPPHAPPGHPDQEEVLQSMFLQNTGSHMLDSGGIYGYTYQHNAVAPPWTKPHVVFEDEPNSVLLNAYKHLDERISFGEMDRGKDAIVLEKALYAYTAMQESRHASQVNVQLGDVEAWLESLGKRVGNSWVHNTYNHENFLDHVLQYTTFTLWINGELKPFIALQVHLGCDVRGGYGSARIWELEYEHSLIGVEEVYFSCTKCSHEVYTYCRDEERNPKMRPLPPGVQRDGYAGTWPTCPKCRAFMGVRP